MLVCVSPSQRDTNSLLFWCTPPPPFSCLLFPFPFLLPLFSLSAALLGGEEERAPVPPPRRKRKKQRMQKQSSLDELEVLHSDQSNFANEFFKIDGFHGP